MPDTATKSISLSAMQTEKARSVRLADKAKRDPVLRKVLVASTAKDKDIEALTALNIELAEASSKLTADLADLRAAYDKQGAALAKATETLHSAQSALEESQAEAKSAQAEAEKARADLASALKKAKPAGGQ